MFDNDAESNVFAIILKYQISVKSGQNRLREFCQGYRKSNTSMYYGQYMLKGFYFMTHESIQRKSYCISI